MTSTKTKDPTTKHVAKKRDNVTNYIKPILTHIHPDMSLTKEANLTINLMLMSLMSRLMHQANIVILSVDKKTVSSREIQAAVRLLLPGELSRHAVSEGTKAITKYTKSLQEKTKSETAVTKHSRAGLVIPVARIDNMMRTGSVVDRASDGAAVYMAAVIEYIAAEILELSGNAARDNKRSRISPRFIQLALHNDDELRELYKNSIIGASVFPTSVSVPSSKKADEEVEAEEPEPEADEEDEKVDDEEDSEVEEEAPPKKQAKSKPKKDKPKNEQPKQAKEKTVKKPKKKTQKS